MIHAEKNCFSVSLCCPLPRKGFGDAKNPTDSELDELCNFLQMKGDMIVFPEGFLHADNLPAAEELVRQSGKWVVCGMEDGEPGKDFSVVVLSPEKGRIFTHYKTALTDGDLKDGRSAGKTINTCKTPFGIIGTPLCYEIHFPEISRILSLLGAMILINPIGTGMWHRQQLYEWTTIAAARAIENRAFVLGCTHYCDAVPMAYAFGPDGRELGLLAGAHGALTVDIDLSKITERDWLRHRTPALYDTLSNSSLSNVFNKENESYDQVSVEKL